MPQAGYGNDMMFDNLKMNEYTTSLSQNNYELDPEPLSLNQMMSMNNRNAGNTYETSLQFDNQVFVPRQSLFRGSTQSILTDYSDMLESIRTFDDDDDDDDIDAAVSAFDNDFKSHNPVTKPALLPQRSYGSGSFARYLRKDVRRSSSKRDSLLSIMSDITDISAALTAVQMDDVDETDEHEQAEDGKQLEAANMESTKIDGSGNRRQSVVRFSVESGQQSSLRRGGFAINEFMAPSLERGGSMSSNGSNSNHNSGGGSNSKHPAKNSQRDSNQHANNTKSSLRSNKRYTGQDMTQAAAFLAADDDKQQPTSLINSMTSSSSSALKRTSSVRFSLPPEAHFDLEKVVSEGVRMRRDTTCSASSLLRRSIMSDLTYFQDDLDDDDEDFHTSTANNNNNNDASGASPPPNPMMLWNAADSNVNSKPRL